MNIKWKYEELVRAINNYRFKKLYPQWDELTWCDHLEFIWGIKSYDDLTGQGCNFHTMNAMDICYDHKHEVYCVSIETAYGFDNTAGEVKYLKGLLGVFETFMDNNEYSKDEKPILYMSSPQIECSAESIPLLYTQFKMYVEGYASLM